MVSYYVDLAVRSLRRNKVLTALMVVAIALGIGASMTTLTVLYLLSGDPMPGRSDRLYYVQLDAASMEGYTPGREPFNDLTRYDAEALVRSKRAHRQALMTGGNVAIEPDKGDLRPFYARARYASTDFFTMFDTPWLHGGGWSEADDEARARVAVISRQLNDKLFGDQSSVGRSLRLDGNDFQIVGVLDHWQPTPRFYASSASGGFGDDEQVFVPFSTSRDLKLSFSGNTSCWGDTGGDQHGINAPCAWVNLWVELETPQQAAAYRDYLVSYSDEQRAAGRFERPSNVRLRPLMQWLEYQEVVPGDVKLQTWLAFGFLLVCLLNTVGLLLAKFMRRGPEIGIRRALGASRRAIFAQLLVEAATIGAVGGLLGLGLVWLGLWAVRQQPTDYASLAEIDGTMLVMALGLSLFASILAGILPAWRGCQVSPALQVKSH